LNKEADRDTCSQLVEKDKRHHVACHVTKGVNETAKDEKRYQNVSQFTAFPLKLVEGNWTTYALDKS
jgi:hypothetical protein